MTIPDLSGLNTPQAAAALRLEGLALGDIVWEFSTSLEANTVIGQDPAAGTALDAGSKVDVVVAQTPNVRLMYDDNDLTLINSSGGDINLNGLLLVRESDGRALPGARWPLELLPDRGCLQVWS
ncbi:MAG: PASTA domain-containing protein, partial [Anaerolineae bacterium]|nr:PASTA domain-containing protein [Anaerolineae bacterium]